MGWRRCEAREGPLQWLVHDHPGSPERAPPYIRGAQVGRHGGVHYQAVHLDIDRVRVVAIAQVGGEIAPGELVRHSAHDSHCTLIECLFGVATAHLVIGGQQLSLARLPVGRRWQPLVARRQVAVRDAVGGRRGGPIQQTDVGRVLHAVELCIHGGGLGAGLCGVEQTPVDEGVVHERLQHRDDAVLVTAQHPHGFLAARAEVALNSGHLHGLYHHPRQPERHLLRELLAVHGGLEAVAEVDVQQLARVPVQHEVAGVAVAQAQQVAHHGHHRRAARVCRPPLQPHLGGAGLEPHDAVEVIAGGGVQGVLEHLHLLDHCQQVVVRRQPQHQPVLHVQRHLTGVAVLADEGVQGVGVGHPADEAAVGRQGDDGVAGDGQIPLRSRPVVPQHGVDQPEQLHYSLILAQVFVALEQEHVLGAIAAVDGQLAGALLAGDHVQLRGEGGDGHHRLPYQVRPRDRQFQPLGAHEGGGHVLELQHGELGQLLVDALEDVVVQVPRLVQVALLARALVPLAPLCRLTQLPPVRLDEGDFFESAGPGVGHLLVEGLQHVQHALHVRLAEVQPAGLLQRLVPHLVPQDGHADQLRTHQLGLLHQSGGVVAHVVHPPHGGGPPRLGLRFTGHQQRIHQRLRVMPPDAHQQAVDHLAHRHHSRVDARNHLGDDHQPGVDGDLGEAVLQGRLHVRLRPMVEPKGQDAQDVLQILPSPRPPVGLAQSH
mmetsp:Transcript_17483/g.52433  ORF Transcript_17483/g.52433 Transcript_17483/m.52433 type:complete len:714 (+) Transcript_17483:377-2518(+)